MPTYFRTSMLKGLNLFVGLCVLLIGMPSHIAPLANAEERVTTATSRLAADLMYMASDELAGRDVGSAGIAQAGEYIAARFQQLGLETNAFDGGPYQQFTIPGPATLGDPAQNALLFESKQGVTQLRLTEQFTPVSLGSSGIFTGEVVFAGYGITAPELNYDDYADLDVQGKVVIALRKEPRHGDPNNHFDSVHPSPHAFFSTKELNAATHGATALILVNDRSTVAQAGADQLPPLTAAGTAINDRQIPTLFCLRATIDELLKDSLGLSLNDLEAAIDSENAPHSLSLKGVRVRGETSIVQSQTPVRNVVGLLPGQGSLANQYLVIGAHYDHVGMGGAGSLAPGTIAIHNGADDNGSGTAVLLEVAQRLTRELSQSRTDKTDVRERRSIIFIAFTGEELGLLGSKYFVRNPRWPLEQTVAMLNMDMVGRMTENSLTIYGTGTAKQFDGLVDRAARPQGLAIDKQPAGFGPSDHSSFYEVSIPVLHFFTGLHNDYHRPSDDYDKINFSGMAAVSDIVTEIALEIACSPQRPTLLQSAAVAQIGRSTPKARRAVLGVRLDGSRSEPTVIGVSSGGAAAVGGIQVGDIITAIDDKPTPTVEALHRLIGGRKTGDTISVIILRDAQNLRLTATLQEG